MSFYFKLTLLLVLYNNSSFKTCPYNNNNNNNKSQSLLNLPRPLRFFIFDLGEKSFSTAAVHSQNSYNECETLSVHNNSLHSKPNPALDLLHYSGKCLASLFSGSFITKMVLIKVSTCLPSRDIVKINS